MPRRLPLCVQLAFLFLFKFHPYRPSRLLFFASSLSSPPVSRVSSAHLCLRRTCMTFFTTHAVELSAVPARSWPLLCLAPCCFLKLFPNAISFSHTIIPLTLSSWCTSAFEVGNGTVTTPARQSFQMAQASSVKYATLLQMETHSKTSLRKKLVGRSFSICSYAVEFMDVFLQSSRPSSGPSSPLCLAFWVIRIVSSVLCSPS